MTKEQIDAALAKLTRLDEEPDYEGGYWMTEVSNGKYVRFDDVREMLEGLIDAQPSSAGD